MVHNIWIYATFKQKLSVFFNELNTSLRQKTNVYDNITVMGDLNIYTLDITIKYIKNTFFTEHLWATASQNKTLLE